MAVINQMNNELINVKNITRSDGVILESGKLAFSGSINGLTVSTTTLYTVPIIVGFNTWRPSSISFNFTDTTGLTGTMVASIGTNAATYDNIMPSTTFTGFNNLNQQYRYNITGTSRILYASDVITLNITTAFGGGGSVYFDVTIFGEVA